jgi:hypothetical protein
MDAASAQTTSICLPKQRVILPQRQEASAPLTIERYPQGSLFKEEMYQ